MPPRPDDQLIPNARWRELCRGASPGRQWSSEAMQFLHDHVERYAVDLVANIALGDVTSFSPTKRIHLNHAQAAIDRAKDAYTLQLEQRLELHAQKCADFRSELKRSKGGEP